MIPKKLKIGAHTYSVSVTNISGDADCGDTDHDKGLIRINEGLIPSMKFSTLVHEAMHVMNTTLNHELLDSLAEQISQFLVDNKIVKPELLK